MSAGLAQCKSIEIIEAVEGLDFRTVNPSQVNKTVTIGFTLRKGSNVNISLSISNEFRFDGITGLKVDSLFVMGTNHTFPRAGVYYATAVAANELTNATATTAIIIQEPITNFKIGSVPNNHSIYHNLTVYFSVSSGTNVSYYLTFNVSNITGQWLVANGSTGAATIHSNLFPRAGNYSISAIAYNLVTKPMAIIFYVNVETPIEGLWFETSKEAYKTNENVIVYSRMTKGSNAKALLKSNGILFASRSFSENDNFTSRISFDIPGIYVFELVVSNLVSSEVISKTIIVQNPIERFTLITDSPKGISPEVVTFNLTLPIGATKPTNATFVLNYGDNTTLVTGEFQEYIIENHRYYLEFHEIVNKFKLVPTVFHLDLQLKAKWAIKWSGMSS